MSECPNCKSAPTYSEDGKQGDPCVRIYECGRWFLNDHEMSDGKSVTACQLIRSLREELAECRRDLLEWQHEWMVAGRDAERDRIADHLELRASKLEDELAISETSTEIGLERILAVIKSLRREAMALRNNEHRSDT